MGWLAKPYPRKDERITTEKNVSGLEISRVLAKKARVAKATSHMLSHSRGAAVLYMATATAGSPGPSGK